LPISCPSTGEVLLVGHSRFAFIAVSLAAVLVVPAVAARVNGQVESGHLLRQAALDYLKALDASAVRRHVDQELQWHRLTLAGAYDQVGHRSPKWDAAAKDGLELTAQLEGDDPARPGDASDLVPVRLAAARAAGCDDPLVVFLLLHARLENEYGREAAALADVRAAAVALEHTDYPAFRRALALIVAVNAPAELPKSRRPAPASEDKVRATELLDRATALLEVALADASLPDRQVKHLVVELLKGRQSLDVDRWAAYQALVPILTKARPADAAMHSLIAGNVLVDYAWDIRGHEYAEKVPDQHMELFLRRMEEGNRQLAWAIGRNTTDQSIGVAMMRVVLVLGDSDAESSEWFEIARRLSPGSDAPYDNRRNALLQRWGGSDDALLAFGREAFARQEWGSRASLELVEVHQWIAKGPPVKTGYMGRADVCADIKAVYDAFLTRYPDASTDRSRYVHRLMTCKAWSEADTQLRRLGDRASMTVFGGPDKLEADRAAIARHLAPAAP
jgi:hypothetical protein